MQPHLRYTLLAFHLNALLDQGRILDIDETLARAEAGDVLDWLTELFGPEVDLSLMGLQDRTAVIETFRGIANAVDARRKFGVERNGLALLVAYCIQALQQDLLE